MPTFSFLPAIALSLAAISAGASEVHVFTSDKAGFNTNTVWYDDGREVTVIDTQFVPAIAEQVVADITAKTRSPITRVVVTHPNPDKFNALSVFHHLGATSIASRATAEAIPGVDAYKRYFWTKIAKAFTDETYPKVDSVRETFSGRKTITLASGETLTLIELAQPGVSSAQTVVCIDSSGDLVVGDLVAYRTHAWLEGGIVGGKATPTIAGWKADLQQLTTLGTGKVYPGRGAPAPVAEAAREEIAYLDRVDALVGSYVTGLGARACEIADGTKSHAHFIAIQAEVAKAFPDYAQPDLVGYGVYGLAQSKLPAAASVK